MVNAITAKVAYYVRKTIGLRMAALLLGVQRGMGLEAREKMNKELIFLVETNITKSQLTGC